VKVVHVSDCYLPRVGGIETQVAGLAHAQACSGHDVHVVTLTPDHGRRTPDEGVGVRRPTRHRPAVAAGVCDLDRILRTLDPDVIHAHTSLVSPLAATAARRGSRAGVATVVTVHSMWDPLSRAAYGAADRTVGWTRWPVLWTTVSEAAAATMRPVLPSRPVVVPNAVDVRFWQAVERPPRPPDEIHVVAVGRLAPRKRPLDIVRVLADARRRLPRSIRLRATVVGDGPERRRLVRTLARRGMSGWVTLVGALGRPAVRDVLAGADVFLAPATRESFGIAALEARTAGLAVLARTGTGVADFVHDGREGLLAASRDGLTDALVILAHRAELRSAITEYNRATPPWPFGWPAALTATDACYGLAGDLTGRRLPGPAVLRDAGQPTPPRPAPRPRSRECA
jgi:glycosyltransferase involved in cell wall biosynthesis